MSATTQTTLQHIPLNQIRENPVALRQVNRNTEAYLELVDSIKTEGVLNPIVVRPLKDPETGEQFYALIDGLHRYTASMDAGKPSIPANIKSMEDAQVLVTQIITNIHKIETKPVEYSKQLQKILAQDPLLTAAQLAGKLGKSITWLGDRLSLSKLDKTIQAHVDQGQINLSNAFALAKLPEEEQAAFVDRAMTMSPAEFTPTILNRKKELDTARRQGKDATPAEFSAPIHIRKISELKTELAGAAVGPQLVREAEITNLKTKGEIAEAAFALAVKWVLHQDPNSVSVAKTKDEERKKALADKRDAAAKVKVKERADEAAVKAARLGLEAEMIASKKSNEEIKTALADYDKAHGLVDGKKPPKVEAVATT